MQITHCIANFHLLSVFFFWSHFIHIIVMYTPQQMEIIEVSIEYGQQNNNSTTNIIIHKNPTWLIGKCAILPSW